MTLHVEFRECPILTENTMLLDRLRRANPGWSEWDTLVSFVSSLNFEFIESDYLGNFYVSGDRLCFSELDDDRTWPKWLPSYVPALLGMKADNWEMAGGFADSFYNQRAKKGAIFSPAGNDTELGYPVIDIPKNLYYFQSNSSGALFFVNKELRILYPNSEENRFDELDTLEAFTRKNIQKALEGKQWFDAYLGLNTGLLD